MCLGIPGDEDELRLRRVRGAPLTQGGCMIRYDSLSTLTYRKFMAPLSDTIRAANDDGLIVRPDWRAPFAIVGRARTFRASGPRTVGTHR